jgi:hypothetical protein
VLTLKAQSRKVEDDLLGVQQADRKSKLQKIAGEPVSRNLRAVLCFQ